MVWSLRKDRKFMENQKHKLKISDDICEKCDIYPNVLCILNHRENSLCGKTGRR